MPLDNQRLVIEPSFPNAEALASIGLGELTEPEPKDARLRNQWFSHRLHCRVAIYEEGGKIKWGKIPAIHHLTQDLQTLGCADAWGIDQEMRAMQLLGDLVSPRAFRQYILTGSFLETSKKSRVTYLFRRLKPTVAIVPGKTESDYMHILAALCMHPIAYYAGSWGGAMCPTDDVIAHLMLMRADEHMFWKRCNQHPPHTPEAGL